MEVNDTEKKIGIGVGLLTLIAIVWGFIGSVREEAYKNGRESLQQEINTIAKEALQNQIDKLKENFDKELERIETIENEKHKQLEDKIERGDKVVSDKVNEAKEFALAEVSGNRADWNVAINHLKELIYIELSKK